LIFSYYIGKHVGKENVGTKGKACVTQEDSMIFKIVRENESRPESERLKWSEIA